jgi:hypothetical protein
MEQLFVLRMLLKRSALYAVLLCALLAGIIRTGNRYFEQDHTARFLSADADELRRLVYYKTQEEAGIETGAIEAEGETRSVPELRQAAAIARPRAEEADYQADLLGMGEMLLIACFWAGLTVYVSAGTREEETLTLILIAGQILFVLGAGFFAVKAFYSAVVAWLATPVGSYTIGRVLVASVLVAIVLGAAYYDFFRRKQSPEQC